MKEEYLAIKVVLEKLDYNANQLIICVDLKIVNFLLNQNSGTLSTHFSYACGKAEQETSPGIKSLVRTF